MGYARRPLPFGPPERASPKNLDKIETVCGSCPSEGARQRKAERFAPLLGGHAPQRFAIFGTRWGLDTERVCASWPPSGGSDLKAERFGAPGGGWGPERFGAWGTAGGGARRRRERREDGGYQGRREARELAGPAWPSGRGGSAPSRLGPRPALAHALADLSHRHRNGPRLLPATVLRLAKVDGDRVDEKPP